MDLPGLWRRHQEAAFPASCLPLSIEGLPLVKLDASVGAILTASLRTDGVPRPVGRRDELVRGRDLVRRALAECALDDEGRAYFERLALLSDALLTG